MPLSRFHPATAAWFKQCFNAPTAVQCQAWPVILQRQHLLISAPTGAGKTLAAFLTVIDQLVRRGLEQGLENRTSVLYVSPLKALSNDIQKNLQQPLHGINAGLRALGEQPVEIEALVRTGDTPQAERNRMRRRPPHIIATTPESLYIMLSSASGRKLLATVETVIVDEIHALAGNKRGAHLSLSLERLSANCESPPVRIGLSATQNPIEEMAMFLIGNSADECNIVDVGAVRERDLSIETTASPLEAVLANEVWSEIYDSLEQQIREHNTTLIFVNTRRLAERVTHALAQRLGADSVTAHHGSLAREHRLDAEIKLKTGRLQALVATASLELGIDIGDIDLVCQLGSPRAINTLLQRVGRSGHSLSTMPKGRLYPLSRDDLVECVALLDAARRNELDRIRIPDAPLDVLAQHIVAEVANDEWQAEELFRLFSRARPYQDLSYTTFTDVLQMLADGYTTRRGRRGAYLHWDRVNNMLRGRRGAKTVAVTNGGAIPDHFDYEVVLQPEGIVIGSLNEDFAFESLPGDIFLLGNVSYRLLKIERGKVHVEDAQGQPPNIPFWFGEAPGRTDELSIAVSRLRRETARRLDQGIEATTLWLLEHYKIPLSAAKQLSEYLGAAKAVFGTIPTREQILFERFFDETGDMHLVIHSTYGSRINRAWGLALRKRFCRKFNFELQAAATEDNIILSLGATHSFALDEVADYLHPETVREVLIQALLTAPMFPTRWRWVANISLAVPRNRNGKRVPAAFQRNDAEDLIAQVFPDQIACQENLSGEREIPDHPLVRQTLTDCTTELMDIDGLERLLQALRNGEVSIQCHDLSGPSPLAQEILNTNPYAFLDDAPAEERRTLAVQQRRYMDSASAAELGRLSEEAIDKVRHQAWPEVQNSDELHDALMLAGFITASEGLEHAWTHLFDSLLDEQRAVKLSPNPETTLWVARERLHEFIAAFPGIAQQPAELPPLPDCGPVGADTARREILRSRLEVLGPVTAPVLFEPCLPSSRRQAEQHEAAPLHAALAALEQEGFAVKGLFTPGAAETEWCDRGLLARIHRYTLKQLRSEIEPVPPSQFMRFLFQWQHLTEPLEGQEAIASILLQLDGVSVPAAAWEKEILPARVRHYASNMLDNLTASGRYTWLRLRKKSNPETRTAVVSITPLAIVARGHLPHWRRLHAGDTEPPHTLSSNAQQVYHFLKQAGASFFIDIVQHTGLLRTHCEAALAELVAAGLGTADSFAGLRALVSPARRRHDSRRGRRRHSSRIDEAGRWSLLATGPAVDSTDAEANRDDRYAPLCLDTLTFIAGLLLKRYGIVFRRLLEREPGLPPWRELLYVYRAMEARGEIRGGRFVQGFSGEQYALPEAVGSLRRLGRQTDDEEYLSIAAVDPLNLTGIVTPGDRIPAVSGNRILYRQGKPIAVSVAGNIKFFSSHDAMDEWAIRNALLGSRGLSTSMQSHRPN